MEPQSPRDVLAAVRRMEDELDAARRATRERERQLEDVRAGVAAEQALERRQVVEDLERVVDLIGAGWRDTRARMAALAEEVAGLRRLTSEVTALRREAEGLAGLRDAAADVAALRASAELDAAELRRVTEELTALRRSVADGGETRRIAADLAELRRVVPRSADLRRLADEIADLRRVADTADLRGAAADLAVLRTVADDVAELRRRAGDVADVRRLSADVAELRRRSDDGRGLAGVVAEMAELRRTLGDASALRDVAAQLAEIRHVADAALTAVRGARVELHLGGTEPPAEPSGGASATGGGTALAAGSTTEGAAPADTGGVGARTPTPAQVAGDRPTEARDPRAEPPTGRVAPDAAPAVRIARAVPTAACDAASGMPEPFPQGRPVAPAAAEHPGGGHDGDGHGNGNGGAPAVAATEQAAGRPAAAPEPVLLYDSPGCWKCEDVREALTRLGVPHRAITVRGDPAARAALVAAMGEPPQVPMLVDGRRAVWDRRRILAYLEETYGGAPPAEGTRYTEMPSFMGGTCRLDDEGCAA